jgi:hypothetical protein
MDLILQPYLGSWVWPTGNYSILGEKLWVSFLPEAHAEDWKRIFFWNEVRTWLSQGKEQELVKGDPECSPLLQEIFKAGLFPPVFPDSVPKTDLARSSQPSLWKHLRHLKFNHDKQLTGVQPLLG